MLSFFGKDNKANASGLSRRTGIPKASQSPRQSSQSMLRRKSLRQRELIPDHESGILSRAGSGLSVQDVDDEMLEKLVGGATHLSLGRKGSRGKLIKVPSHERFGALVPRGRSSSDSSDNDDEQEDSNDTFSRMLVKHGSRHSLTRMSSDLSKRSSFCVSDTSFAVADQFQHKTAPKRALPLIGKSPRSCRAGEDSSSLLEAQMASPKIARKLGNLTLDIEEEVPDDFFPDTPQQRNTKRKLTSNASKERLDELIKNTRASFSN